MSKGEWVAFAITSWVWLGIAFAWHPLAKIIMTAIWFVWLIGVLGRMNIV